MRTCSTARVYKLIYLIFVQHFVNFYFYSLHIYCFLAFVEPVILFFSDNLAVIESITLLIIIILSVIILLLH